MWMLLTLAAGAYGVFRLRRRRPGDPGQRLRTRAARGTVHVFDLVWLVGGPALAVEGLLVLASRDEHSLLYRAVGAATFAVGAALFVTAWLAVRSRRRAAG